MEGKSLFLLLCLLAIHESKCLDIEKRPKISLFNVVQFPNTNCAGNNGNNGTCYTQQECDIRNGANGGSCADGYGVCCVISLACGAQTAENITYLQMAATVNPPSTSCEYTICPSNSNVCRIRFDLETFNIAPPFVEPFTNTPNVQPGKQGLRGGAIGDCVTDTFTISGVQYSSPQICGINTGQHLYADVNSECVKPAFRFGTSIAAPQREYRIKITQYVCGDEFGGPIGCLQYFTGEMGRVASFNFPLTATTIVENTPITHLSDQNYNMCFRRAVGKCRLCFSPSIETNGAPDMPASFGLGKVTDAAANVGRVGNECTEDYLIIPQMINADAINPDASNAQANRDKICGRRFNTNNADPAGTTVQTICTSRVPFAIKFRSDQDERAKLNGRDLGNDETENNVNGDVPGYLGFSLDFLQEDC